MSKPRTSTNAATIAIRTLRDTLKAEVTLIREGVMAPLGQQERTCPVCSEPPGDGFNTYCSTEHMLEGSPRG